MLKDRSAIIMALDGNFIHELMNEFTPLKGGRINKIHQIDPYTIILKIRAERKTQTLLVSCHPSLARIHFTNESYETPFEPPMFLRMLRRDLESGIIRDIKQIGNDRRIHMRVTNRDEIGDEIERELIIEIMGRHSNIILTDEHKQIIFAMKHISLSENERPIQPGIQYEEKKKKKKLNPRTEEINDLPKYIDFNGGKLNRQILNNVEGVSLQFIEEAEHRVKFWNIKNIVSGIEETLSALSLNPTLYIGNRDAFYYSELETLNHQYDEKIHFDTLSELLDEFYHSRYIKQNIKRQANDYLYVIEQNYDKTKRKIEKLNEDIEESHRKEDYQKYGELLTAYMHELKPYSEEAKVFDYYENKEITIPLKVHLSPADNAQRYYHLYNEMKIREIEAEKQLDIAKMDLNYLETLLHQMESISTTEEVEDIREELMSEGIIKEKKRRKRKKKHAVHLNKYKTTNGLTVLVGKNNTQNDYLTNRHASKNHLWFHVKDMPGSHVVIMHVADEITEDDIMEAAKIAAYHSKGKESQSVPVDYTEIRHVKNIPGTKPGFVTYTDQKTVYVTPVEREIRLMEDSE